MAARWFFDFISPFAYLQRPAVVELARRVDIEPVPVVLGVLLRHHGQLGPAEIPSKREFTYRMAMWRAERDGVPLVFPPAHPFNPMAALRLAIAAGTRWDAIGAIFDHVWKEGRAADSAEALAGVAREIGIDDAAAAIARDDVKAALRANTDAAVAAGVFGVPTLEIDGEIFWGADATPMAIEYLDDRERFRGEDYRRLVSIPYGIERRR